MSFVNRNKPTILVDLLSRLAQHYDLGHCDYVDEYISWGQHIRLLIQSSDHGKMFLKERPAFLNPAEYSLHIRAHAYLAEQNSCVVPIMWSNTGDLIFEWQGRHFYLQKWLPARAIHDDNDNDAWKLGVALGQFLKDIWTFPATKHERSFAYPSSRGSFSPSTWPEILAYIGLIDHAVQAHNTRHIIFEITEWLRNWVQKTGKQMEPFLFPAQFVHGDIQRFNCIVDSLGQVYLVDLERLHWSYRIMEIANACIMLGAFDSPIVPPQAHTKSALNRRIMSKTFSGVQSQVELSQIEEDHFGYFLGFALVRNFIGALDFDVPTSLTVPDDLETQLMAVVTMIEEMI